MLLGFSLSHKNGSFIGLGSKVGSSCEKLTMRGNWREKKVIIPNNLSFYWKASNYVLWLLKYSLLLEMLNNFIVFKG
jgi:hypothetical protein